MFLVGSLGAFALVRLAAGLLLALGPLFIAFLLFTATRGVAEGWMRGLLAATLGSAAIAVVLGVELALLDPWLVDLVTRRASGIAIPGIPVAMLATASIFAIATGGLLAIVTRIAFGLRLPASNWAIAQTLPVPVATKRERTGSAVINASAAGEPRSRATAIADSITATQRREEQAGSIGLSRAVLVSGSVSRTRARADQDGARGVPLGQSFRRRTVQRVSGSAATRDRPS
ncbi:type IV secretion system protein [Sphingomonas aurantiaca]|uniref:type IV secretion system protein n=1 Tax=Sphingomonas aurantiaca TaxID=185949 RepID=UPI003A5BE22A